MVLDSFGRPYTNRGKMASLGKSKRKKEIELERERERIRIGSRSTIPQNRSRITILDNQSVRWRFLKGNVKSFVGFTGREEGP